MSTGYIRHAIRCLVAAEIMHFNVMMLFNFLQVLHAKQHSNTLVRRPSLYLCEKIHAL